MYYSTNTKYEIEHERMKFLKRGIKVSKPYLKYAPFKKKKLWTITIY